MGFFGGKKQGGSSSEKLRPSNVGAREFPRDAPSFVQSIATFVRTFCAIYQGINGPLPYLHDVIIVVSHPLLLLAPHCYLLFVI